MPRRVSQIQVGQYRNQPPCSAVQHCRTLSGHENIYSVPRRWSPMTLTTTRQPDLHDEPDIATMDTIATGVAQQVADNTLDEHPARAQILSCLVSSPAIAAMVELFRRQTPSSAESMSEAVRTECEKRIRVKVLATNGAGLDLELLTTSSATGWAERFLRSGAQWIFANAARSVREDATTHIRCRSQVCGLPSPHRVWPRSIVMSMPGWRRPTAHESSCALPGPLLHCGWRTTYQICSDRITPSATRSLIF